MNDNIQKSINTAVQNMIKDTFSEDKLKSLNKKHNKKIHFVPKKYRVLSGLLQSMNIQFGNFIEELMHLLIENDERYEILTESGKKKNLFYLSKANNKIINDYIDYNDLDYDNYNNKFYHLMETIINNNSKCDSSLSFKCDIDLLFKKKKTGIIYYIEIKYNNNHDTGKSVDIYRKIIKTYACLTKALNIEECNKLRPILLFFTSGDLKKEENMYLPEEFIRRGDEFFNEFLMGDNYDVYNYITHLSENPYIIEMFDKFIYRYLRNT